VGRGGGAVVGLVGPPWPGREAEALLSWGRGDREDGAGGKACARIAAASMLCGIRVCPARLTAGRKVPGAGASAGVGRSAVEGGATVPRQLQFKIRGHPSRLRLNGCESP
jgi:hypothetical protein